MVIVYFFSLALFILTFLANLKTFSRIKSQLKMVTINRVVWKKSPLHSHKTEIQQDLSMKCPPRTKVIIHKLRGEVSLVEQDTIEYIPQPIKNSIVIYLTLVLCNFLVQMLQYTVMGFQQLQSRQAQTSNLTMVSYLKK